MPTPRQIAIALRYLAEKDTAPRVVAKGRGYLAEEIVRLAKESGVPIRRQTDLAEVLVKLDLGQEIPEELYQAVAEVLAFIYRMDRAARAGAGAR